MVEMVEYDDGMPAGRERVFVRSKLETCERSKAVSRTGGGKGWRRWVRFERAYAPWMSRP